MTDTPPDDDNTTTAATSLPPGWLPCPLCTTPFRRVRRRRFCSDNCRKAAWSHSRQQAPQPAVKVPPAQRRRDVTVYSCPSCQERFYGQQWCHDCNQPCTRVGPGGLCPNCESPVAHADLGASS
jgi:hypothetical protein